MKILAVSMLRIGDLIMHENVLLAFFNKNPQAEIHLLVNDVSERFAKTLACVSKVHIFNRSQWQKCLLEDHRPVLNAYRGLSDLIDNLNREKYDQVLNLTHTRVSARLMDLLSTPVKMGMAFENGNRAVIENPWQNFMNENFSRCMRSPFHYVDALNAAMGQAPLMTDNKAVFSGDKKFIALQPLTSDEKKNWPTRNYLAVALLLKKTFPEKEIIVLAAPGEQSILASVFENIDAVQLRVLTWAELKDVLQETALLITGDTSVQHLAAQRNVPVLSLFLSGGTIEKTSPYAAENFVLQPGQQDAHELSVDDVHSVAQMQLLEMTQTLPELKSNLYRTCIRPSGFHFLKKIGKGTEMFNVKRALEQTVWQIYLDKGHMNPVGPFGSSSYNFMQEFSQELKTTIVQEWLNSRFSLALSHSAFLEQLESEFRRKSAQGLTEHSKSNEAFHHLAELVKNYLFRRSDEGHDYFFNLEQELDQNGIDFAGIQKVRQAFYEAKFLIQIETQFLKSLLQELKEREVVYVAGTRTLLDAGFAAP